MARKLKTYQTSIGFFDLAIAAPSMKAALEAWGSKSNLFHQGVAKEVDDPKVIGATISKPGVILRRPVGSNGPFKEHAHLPTHLPADGVKDRSEQPSAKLKKQTSRKLNDKEARKATLAFEREQSQRDSERRKEEAAQAKQRERRERATAKAQAALEAALNRKPARRAREALPGGRRALGEAESEAGDRVALGARRLKRRAELCPAQV
jgi:colicin import membrane protein